MEVYFILKCKNCNWFRKTLGISEQLKDLTEVGCKSCGGARKFKCPQCGTHVKMVRHVSV